MNVYQVNLRFPLTSRRGYRERTENLIAATQAEAILRATEHAKRIGYSGTPVKATAIIIRQSRSETAA